MNFFLHNAGDFFFLMLFVEVHFILLYTFIFKMVFYHSVLFFFVHVYSILKYIYLQLYQLEIFLLFILNQSII